MTAETAAQECPECGTPAARVDIEHKRAGEVIYTFRPCMHRFLIGPASPLAMIPHDGIVLLPSCPLPLHRPTGTGWPA